CDSSRAPSCLEPPARCSRVTPKRALNFAAISRITGSGDVATTILPSFFAPAIASGHFFSPAFCCAWAGSNAITKSKITQRAIFILQKCLGPKLLIRCSFLIANGIVDSKGIASDARNNPRVRISTCLCESRRGFQNADHTRDAGPLDLIFFAANVKALRWNQAHLLSGIMIDMRIRFGCHRVETRDESVGVEKFQNLGVDEHLFDFYGGQTVGQVGNDAEAQRQDVTHYR